FLPMELTFLFLAVNIPNLLKYASICLSAARVAAHHPELHAQAGFRPPAARMRVMAIAGALCALALIAVGFEAGWRPYALLGGWLAVGVVYYLVKQRGR